MNKTQKIMIVVIAALSAVILTVSYLRMHKTKSFEPICNYQLGQKIGISAFDTGTFLAPQVIIEKSIVDHRMNGFDLDEQKIKNQGNPLIAKGFSFVGGKKVSACLEKINLEFMNANTGIAQQECFALSYLNDNSANELSSIQAMRCDEINDVMRSWIKLNEVEGMALNGFAQ